MHPFARDLAALGDDLAVAQLRYRVRGWNDSGDDALADVAFALAALDARYDGVPVRPRRALDGWTGGAARRPVTRRCGAWSRWRRGCRAPNRSSSSPVATSWCCTAPATARPARARRRGSSRGRCRSPDARCACTCRGAVTACCRALPPGTGSPPRSPPPSSTTRRSIARSSSHAPPGVATSPAEVTP